MNEDEPRQPGGTPEASEEELRQRLDEEVRKLRVQDVLLQSVVSLINLTSRRIAKEDERDLGQARIGIDAVRSLVELLEPEPAEQVRNALAELQVAYAKEARERPGAPAEPSPAEATTQGSREDAGAQRKPPSRLWTPPGSG
jgi:hypothetical protein